MKKLGRITRIGHRITGNRSGHYGQAGWEFVHVAIDDTSRVAYAQVLPDEQADRSAAFLRAAVAYYAGLGLRIREILTDNGAGYRSREFARTCADLDLKHRYTRPYTPRTNGKAAFARDQFALQHRYALVLHTDQPHPDVHLVVKAMSEQGRRINIRKETLREWRRNFARHLRAQGIAANATERAVRGVTKPQKSDGIYRAMRAGRSTHMHGRIESVAAALHAGNLRVEPGKKRILDTRREVVRLWLGVREALRAEGRAGIADEVERFIAGMPPPQTERELMALVLTEGMRNRRQERSLAPTR